MTAVAWRNFFRCFDCIFGAIILVLGLILLLAIDMDYRIKTNLWMLWGMLIVHMFYPDSVLEEYYVMSPKTYICVKVATYIFTISATVIAFNTDIFLLWIFFSWLACVNIWFGVMFCVDSKYCQTRADQPTDLNTDVPEDSRDTVSDVDDLV